MEVSGDGFTNAFALGEYGQQAGELHSDEVFSLCEFLHTVTSSGFDAAFAGFRLGQVCESHGWKVHPWVLMRNYFYLLLETPESNLVTGMNWLLGTFSQGWNALRSPKGHASSMGRHKGPPLSMKSQPSASHQRR